MIVLLDLDGTVWDSEDGIVRCVDHALATLGRTVPPRAHLVRAIGPPLRSMLEHLGVPEEQLDDGVAAYRDRYLTVGVYESALYPGVTDMLDRLAAAGGSRALMVSVPGVRSPARLPVSPGEPARWIRTSQGRITLYQLDAYQRVPGEER